MRKSVLRFAGQHAFRVGVTGLVLAAPMTLSAATPPGESAAPVIQQMDGATPVSPVAAPQQSQFQSQQYQNEVQRQLQMLYQQQNSGQPAAPPPQAAGPRKMRMKDWFNPSAWKRQYTRRQRERQREEQRREAAAAGPETNLGSPSDITYGGAAPLPAAPSVPLSASPAPIAQQSPNRLVAPDPMPATAAAPVITPAPVAARPQLQRVSPEIFAGEADAAPKVAAAPAYTPPVAPPVEFPVAQAPQFEAAPAAAANPTDPQVAEAPLLIITPNPDTTLTPLAPPAEMPFAAATEPATDIGSDGFINEAAELEFAAPVPAEEELLFGAQQEPAPVTETEPLNEQPNGPFTGLELESNPFAEQPQTVAAPAPFPAEPSPFTAPAESESTPALPAAGEADQTESLLAPPLTDAQLPAEPAIQSSTADASSGVPATLTVQSGGRPLSAAGLSSVSAGTEEVQIKLSRIAERRGLTGFKGFCPVMLKDHRELVDAKLEHTVEFGGRQYWFSSATARAAFMADPMAYIPARNGIDVVVFDRTGETREGSLDHAVWYRGQLFMFDSAESQAEFAAAPLAHQISE